MIERRRSCRRAGSIGMTLLEVVVSAAILAALTLMLVLAFVPLQRATVDGGVAQDMERVARKVLTEIRRELRSSGYDAASVDQVTSPSTPAGAPTTATVLTFRKRRGLLDSDWSGAITIQRVADGTFSGVPGTINRYKVTRTEAGLVVDLAKDVSELSFERPGNSSTVIIRLELTRPNPHWISGSPPPPFKRLYVDQVECLNPR